MEIFIISQFLPVSQVDKVKASFKGVASRFTVVDSFFEINNLDKEEDGWYGVFYENEEIEDELLVALDSFFELTKADVLVAFKREPNRITKCPRFFRSHVELKIDSLEPLDREIPHEIMLNGYIKEHD